MSKKILLIEPPFYRLYHDHFSLDRYPLSLGYIAGAIQTGTDWEVRVLNADFNTKYSSGLQLVEMAGKGYDRYISLLNDSALPIWKEIEAKIRAFAPDVVGITSKTQNYASAQILIEIAKRIRPDVRIVVGGPHPSMAGEQVLENQDVDVAVVGEGEETIVELLKTLETGSSLHNVNGIVFRDQDGEIIRTLPRAYTNDLDVYPFPHTSAESALIDYEKYPKTAFKNIFATRGCPYACQFCGSRNIWSRKVRYRSAENVAEEIRQLRKFGLDTIHFDDDTFGLSKKYIKALCEEIKRQTPDISWTCETTVNVLDEDTVGWMKDTGCRGVYIGIESGNNKMLRTIRKNITIEKAYAAAELLKKNDIYVGTFFMTGFPNETEETMADTLRAMKRIKTDVIWFSIYTPYPGTEGFEIAKSQGLVDDSYDVALYNHQSPENCFTANIPAERFRILAKKMMIDVDKINLRNKRMSAFSYYWGLSRNSLKKNGLLPTMGKAVRAVVMIATSRYSHKRS